jgi:hypothetical protein
MCLPKQIICYYPSGNPTLLEMKCKVFENKVTILPSTAQQTEVAEILKVALPVEIPLPIDSNKAFDVITYS